MANGMVPPGYQAVLIGSAPTLEGLKTLAPMEENSAEGTLMLAQVDLANSPTAEALADLNQRLIDQGVPPWPGYGYVVYADTQRPTVYIAWQKWQGMLAIIGIGLASIILPPLIGIGLWALMPESLKQLLSSIMQMGMMAVMMFVMMMVMKPMMESASEPKRVEGRARHE